MKIYQSKHRILAAQILAINQHDTAPLFQLTTDAESVQVDRAWMQKHNPVVGGHVTIAPDTGIAGYLGAVELPTGFDLVGMVDLTPPAEQGQALPEPELPVTPPAFATYTFDQFVEQLRACPTTTYGDNGMPWSSQFWNRPVTHERDDCYLISDGTKEHYFTTAYVLHLTPIEAPDEEGRTNTITLALIEKPAAVATEEAAQ